MSSEPGVCRSKTTRDFDDANSQVFFMDNSSDLQAIQEIQVTSTS